MDSSRFKALALVPARGGSKRLPRKTLTLLSGKPLLAWTVATAFEAGIFDDVWVSSEDDEILSVASALGARTLRRPSALADDRATVVQVAQAALQDVARQGRSYSALYVLLPTSPLRRKETIRKAWQTFDKSGAEALMSVVRVEHPPQWALREMEGWIEPLYPKEFELNRQSLIPAFRHDGGHFIVQAAKFMECTSIGNLRTLAFPVAEEEAVDVNTSMDLAWAEFLLQRSELTTI